MANLYIDLFGFKQGRAYGYQEYIFNLLDYFHTHRNELLCEEVIIVCNKSQLPFFEQYKSKFKFRTFRYTSKIKRLLLQPIWNLFVKMKRCDVILHPGNFSCIFKRTKEILVIHDLLYKRKEFIPNRIFRWQHDIVVPRSLLKADEVIAISNFTKNDIASFFPSVKEKTRVIYNYFNFKKFTDIGIEDNKNKRYMLSVCSAAFHKNTITVLKAYERYVNNGGVLDLYLVGSLNKGTIAGNYYFNLNEEIQQRIKCFNKISTRKLAGLYENATFYVSASLFEGLGMPIVEAMYFNLPVILSDDIVFKEVSLGLGQYFQPLDDITLSQLFLLNEKTEKCTYSEKIIDFYSEENTSSKYVIICNKLLKCKRPQKVIK